MAIIKGTVYEYKRHAVLTRIYTTWVAFTEYTEKKNSDDMKDSGQRCAGVIKEVMGAIIRGIVPSDWRDGVSANNVRLNERKLILMWYGR